MIYLASQSTVKVENNVTVEGNSQIQRTMDVTVNGKRTVVEKNTAGSDTITVVDGVVTHTEGDDAQLTPSPTIAPDVAEDATGEVQALEKLETKEKVIVQASPSSKMKDMSLFEYLFKKLFGMFRKKE